MGPCSPSVDVSNSPRLDIKLRGKGGKGTHYLNTVVPVGLTQFHTTHLYSNGAFKSTTLPAWMRSSSFSCDFASNPFMGKYSAQLLAVVVQHVVFRRRVSNFFSLRSWRGGRGHNRVLHAQIHLITVMFKVLLPFIIYPLLPPHNANFKIQ